MFFWKKKNLAAKGANSSTLQLCNNDICVSNKGSFSSQWTAFRGFRQGGVTSAYFFCLYIEDVLSDMHRETYGCMFGLTKQNIQAYADDIVMFCLSSTGPRFILKNLEFLSLELSLAVNKVKTKTMIFNKRISNNFSADFFINGSKYENVNEYKCLGCTLNNKMNETSVVHRL